MRTLIAVVALVAAVSCGADDGAGTEERASSAESSTRAEPPRGPCSSDADCSLGMGCGCTCVATTERGYACHPCAAFPCDTSAVHAACDPATRTCVVAPGGR